MRNHAHALTPVTNTPTTITVHLQYLRQHPKHSSAEPAGPPVKPRSHPDPCDTTPTTTFLHTLDACDNTPSTHALSQQAPLCKTMPTP